MATTGPARPALPSAARPFTGNGRRWLNLGGRKPRWPRHIGTSSDSLAKDTCTLDTTKTTKVRNTRDQEQRETLLWLTGWEVGDSLGHDDISVVIGAAFDEAGRRAPGGHHRTWIVLATANAQIEAITAEAACRCVTVAVICDFRACPGILSEASCILLRERRP